MDFFGQQERARTKTTALVLYFVLAVALMVAAVYAASLLILHFTQVVSEAGAPVPVTSSLLSWRSIALWDPQLFGWVVVGTLGVVLAGAAYKLLRLSRGGSEVAEELGGRLLAAEPTDADERRLRSAIGSRKVGDVERLIGRDRFLYEVRRRGFRAIENAGQFVIFCNRQPVHVLD